MAPTPPKPTLTISTTTHLPGLGQPIILGLGEPTVSRTAAWYERTYPNVRPRPIIPFSDYMVAPETSDAAASRNTGTSAGTISATPAPGSHATRPKSKLPLAAGDGLGIDARFHPALVAASLTPPETAPATSANRKDSTRETLSEKRDRGTQALRSILTKWAEDEEKWCRRGTHALRAMLAEWEEEERRARETEPFPAFDGRMAFEMLWEDIWVGA